MRLRPSRFYRWVAPFFFGAVGVFSLGEAYQSIIRYGLGESWLSGAVGALWLFMAIFVRNFYIQVDETTITFGPSLTPFAAHRNVINRRDVALIRNSRSPWTQRTLFLRSDGTTLRGTPGVLWGRDGMRALASYLDVRLEW